MRKKTNAYFCVSQYFIENGEKSKNVRIGNHGGKFSLGTNECINETDPLCN